MKRIFSEICAALTATIMLCAASATAGEPTVKIGWGRRSINPGEPVAITGQLYLRVSLGEYKPVTADALVLENGRDAVIFVSVDMVMLRGGILDRVKDHLSKTVPEIPGDNIIMNATHTHAGPNFVAPGQKPAVDGITYMEKENFLVFLTKQISDAIIEAWKNRAPGSVAYGYGFATVGHSRRTVYSGLDYAPVPAPGYDTRGLARMYGKTNHPLFSHYEAGTDAFINLLYTFDADGKLTGAIINVPCPAQTNEHAWQLHGGFWSPVREKLRAKYGDIGIVCQCAAAGDLSPRQLHYKEAEKRRYKLKYPEKYREIVRNPLRCPETFFKTPEEEKAYRERDLFDLLRAEDIADRICSAFDEVLEWAKRDRQSAPVLRHKVEKVRLERRMVSEAELKKAQDDLKLLDAEVERLKREGLSPNKVDRTIPSRISRSRMILSRYELQKKNPTLETTIHAVRIGDVSFASNRFELFIDFMHRIQARSPYVQTFVVQLVADPGEEGGSYLATARAAQNLGYSATLLTNQVSADGGQQLVEETLKMLEKLK